MKRFRTSFRRDQNLFNHTAKATNKMNVLKCYPRGGIRM